MRTYTEWLLDSMCFEEWQDAVADEIDAMPAHEVEMREPSGREYLEQILDYEDDIEERDFIRHGGA